ncbi:hypothetical protein MSP8886_01769 [Marinomonas spartinae]|uniref:DUF1853 family protein n=1 Tax=Marinomonas spartinae TaxID=1792290 RepID=A0A1A8TE43_9GAMM|nr:DUF1853 family protein [Marinomonas spartinae]SBS30316.1 hypothetical protein MSP8886_01769 [Marinomonas spartinae]
MMTAEINQYLADLAWVVGSEQGEFSCSPTTNLIESDMDVSKFWVSNKNERLAALALNPEPLGNAVRACKSHFLGSYFETLFSFAIQHLSSFNVLFEHIQIMDKDKKTLGEIDMLVEALTGECIQFEVAIKFYLERTDLYPHHWIGPNKNDSLKKKVDRARGHQLQILKTTDGKQLLQSVTKDSNFQAKLLIFGRLYLALSSPEKVISFCDNSHFGGWIRVSQVDLLLPFFSYYMPLSKPHWLTFSNSSRDLCFFEAQCKNEWRKSFQEDVRPKHIMLLRELEGRMSCHFVFIVPDNW